MRSLRGGHVGRARQRWPILTSESVASLLIWGQESCRNVVQCSFNKQCIGGGQVARHFETEATAWKVSEL